MVVFFEGRRVHPLCPTLSWGARGREQLHKTVYVWVVVFFEEPGMSIIGKMVGENPLRWRPLEESTPFIHLIYPRGV